MCQASRTQDFSNKKKNPVTVAEDNIASYHRLLCRMRICFIEQAHFSVCLIRVIRVIRG